MPRTKQVATKSSGKGKNVEISSSAVPLVDVTKSSRKKSLLAERGFSSVNPNADFISTVTALGWKKFITHRKEYIAPLVRDFYEGIIERNDGKPATVSKCRGEEINFDARTINDHYGLGYFGKAIENKQRSYGLAEMNEVKARICTEDAVWEKSGEHGNEFKILTRYLCDEANLWFHFVRHSLLPTGHTLFVDKERLLVIDAIMSRDKVEVGKLINREMNKWQNRKDGNLYFPCLITDLCIEAGVEIEAGELREEPSGALATKYKPRQRPGNASTSADAQTLQRLVQQQGSLAKFVKEQFEWQKKVVAHVTKGKMVAQEPVLPAWMEEEEEDEEDRMPLSTMHLRNVKKEKAKRVRSPEKKKQSPAKKKQKKSSSEEEFRSSDLDPISDHDADETAKVAEEVNSEEEEEESVTEGEGSSGEKTDIQVDSPPTKEPTVHPSKAAKPKPPPTKSTPQQPSPAKQPTIDQTVPETPQSTLPEISIPQPPPSKLPSPQKDQPPTSNEPEPEPAKEPSQPAAQEEDPVENQPQQRPSQEPQVPNVVASDATKETETVKKPRQRVKHVMTQSPFGKKKRGGSAATEEGQADPKEADEEVQQPDQSEAQRQKLEVRKKQKADKGKPATATSGAFIATGNASVAVSTGATEGSSDAIASNVPEVEKAPTDPVVTKEVSDAELAKQRAWEEAKQRLAEHIAKAGQDAPPAPAVSAETAATSDSPAVAEEEEAEKKRERKKKKKGTQSSQLPPRTSGRLRSGALNK